MRSQPRLHRRLARAGCDSRSAGAAVQHIRRGLGVRRGARTGSCDERGYARTSRAGDDRRRRSRGNAARDAAGATRNIPVRIFERLPDMRHSALPAGRSINLALAARGIRALELAGVMDRVRPLLIPMPGRMLRHRRRADVRALRPRRARSDLLGLAARPQPHPDRRRAARRRRHQVSGLPPSARTFAITRWCCATRPPADSKNVRCDG